MFTAEIINFLTNDIGFAIAGDCTCITTISQPELRSTRYDPISRAYIGLDIDNFFHFSMDQRSTSPCTGFINLGDEPSYLLFINLTLGRIWQTLVSGQSRLACEQDMLPSSIARLFMAKFLYYPIVRLTIRPGEGYIVPTENIIYDFSTLGKLEADILLRIELHSAWIYDVSHWCAKAV